MDVIELFRSCKKGDLETVKFLVEQRELDVNLRDKWDSTPLYYACLCGHTQTVEYLIAVGAKCEANSFDGERCLYGALTEDIRRILTHHNMVSAHTIRRDAYDEFLRRLFESGEYSDVTFIVQGEAFFLHLCLLMCRSEYLHDMFLSKWRQRSKIVINNELVYHKDFAAVMKYIYTGRFECPVENVEGCIRIGMNLKLPKFKQLIEDALMKATVLQVGKHGRSSVTTVVMETEDCLSDTNGLSGSHVVGQDLWDLAQSAVPAHLRLWPTEMPFSHQEDQPVFGDVCFVVEGHEFLCHKMFFCARSEYFRALLEDHFQETRYADTSGSSQLPVITLHDVTAEVFSVLVHFLYCNQANMILEKTTEVMIAADCYLVPGLKRQCGVYLGQRLFLENVFSSLKLARIFQLPRLEDQCVAYMAKNLDQVLEEEELRKLIISDAGEVEGRQETDTVTIVDELRFHITSAVQTLSGIREAHEKLKALDYLLEELGIEA